MLFRWEDKASNFTWDKHRLDLRVVVSTTSMTAKNSAGLNPPFVPEEVTINFFHYSTLIADDDRVDRRGTIHRPRRHPGEISVPLHCFIELMEEDPDMPRALQEGLTDYLREADEMGKLIAQKNIADGYAPRKWAGRGKTSYALAAAASVTHEANEPEEGMEPEDEEDEGLGMEASESKFSVQYVNASQIGKMKLVLGHDEDGNEIYSIQHVIFPAGHLKRSTSDTCSSSEPAAKTSASASF